MKKLLICLFLALVYQSVSAQKVYFIYLQSESKQPFYVKMAGKVHSATASGYLILSKLIDSTYSFTLGFPGNKYPEQSFTIAVNKKDHGYLLKDLGEKGWALFDLQTMQLLNSTSAIKKEEAHKTGEKDLSAFTDILSKAADDPSLKERTVREEKNEVVVAKKEEPAPAVKKDTVVAKVNAVPEKKELPVKEVKADIVEKKAEPVKEADIVEKKVEPVVEEVKAEDYRPSIVKRRSESSTTEGVGIVFTDDRGKGNIDTIRVLIPDRRNPIIATRKEEPRVEKKFLNVDSVKADPVPTERSIVVTEVKKDTIKVEAVLNDSGKVDTVKVVAPKVACKATASQEDFFKLRKSMASVTSDDDMIDEARKYFRTKCFTTQQVKNLSSLFLDEEGKYHFFDAAYDYVTDKDKFPGLQAELKDEYYINRFKAMLR